MTREERNNKLKYFITCMKCEMSGKCRDDENCPIQYDAGNMGEIIENLEEISKILEQEPCEDAISRKAVKELFQEGSVMGMYRFLGIDDLPSVTPERPKGHWINIDATHSKCDRCGAVFEIMSANGETNYCPHCGCRMKSKEMN